MPRGKKPQFAPAQDKQIADLYRAGATTYEIAAKYGCSPTPVRSALERQGVPVRPSGKKRTGWTGSREQRAAVAAAYQSGESVRRIAARLKIRAEVIIGCLDDAGVSRRHPGGRPARDADDTALMVAAYQAGVTLNEIGKQHGVSGRTVASYLARAGVERRHGRLLFWTDERVSEAARRYRAGESQAQIADALGCHQTSVSYVLYREGVRPRAPLPRHEEHQGWKGGRVVDNNGYVRVKLADEDRHLIRPLSNGYVLEHRLVMARAVGRPLREDESVHHINGDRQDNRLENLQLRNGAHGAGVRMACLDCGSHNVGPVPLS